MKLFLVMEPPDGDGTMLSPDEKAMRAVFVKDGIAWWALFFPMLWLLFHRLWLGFLGYLVYAIALVSLGYVLDETSTTIIGVLGAILIAMEANGYRRWALERRGWTLVGEAPGRNRAEAEWAFFTMRERAAARQMASGTTEDGQWTNRPASGVPSVGRRRPDASQSTDDPVLGFFPEPER